MKKSYINTHGYKEVLLPDHPEAKKSGYVLEHRKIYHETYGDIPDGWHIHHLNEQKLQNNPENLVAMPAGTHHALHNYIPSRHRRKVEEKFIRIRDKNG